MSDHTSLTFPAFSAQILAFCLFISSLMIPQLLQAQNSGPVADPLQGKREVVQSNELVLMWANPDGLNMTQKLYDYVSFGNPAIQDSLQTQDRLEVSSSFPTGGDEAMDYAIDDFTGDGIDNIIMIWEGADHNVYAHHPTTGLETSGTLPRLIWESTTPYELKAAGTLNAADNLDQVLRLVPGQFDEDEQYELLMGYIDTAGDLHLEVLSVEGNTLQMQFDAAVLPMPIEGPPMVERSVTFDVNTGDLNDDGIDEIVISTVRNVDCARSQGCWASTIYVYDVTGSSITLLNQADVFTVDDNSSRWIEHVAVELGDYNGDGVDEIAAALHVPHNGSTHRWYLTGLSWDGSALVIGHNESIHQTTGSFGFPLSMKAADMDLDGTEELAYLGRTMQLFAADSAFTEFDNIGGGNFGPDDNNRGRRMIAVADIDGASRMWYSTDNQAVHRPEIIVTRSVEFSDNGGINKDRASEITAFRFTPTQFNLEEIGQIYRDESSDNSGAWTMMLAAGNFGDRGIRVGKPQFYRETEIVQPLVILNAPPLHFDMFDNTPIDVSGCYLGSDCGFAATYTEQTSQTVEVTTQISGDWQIGAGIDGNLNSILDEIPVAGELVVDLLDALGLGIDFNFEASYGEGFSELLGTQRTITLTTQVSTFEDDAIYASVLDYDIWEYPLYVRGQFAGNIAIVLPNPKRDQWFNSKTPEAASYRPGHEFGNILSYSTDLAPARSIEQVFTGSRYTLGTQTVTWDVTREQTQFSESEQSTTLQMSGDIDISLPIPTLNLNINGDYSSQTLNTHRTSVSNLQGVTVNFGQIEATVEGKKANYSVTPFIYWERSGALVVDYAVEPSIAGPGEVPTWWQERYGQLPDPAFNLPGRYDDVKTGNIVDPATLSRTKSLAFYPEIIDPGQTVTIQALISNHSLLPTASEVPVRFYIGDPAAGGVAITGTPTNPDPVAPVIAARGTATVRTSWNVPGNTLDSALRIYAVIDPGNTLSEIHESNNTGWAPLRTTVGMETDIDDAPILPEGFTLHANYPNPFNPATTIGFTLNRPEEIRLAVYDVLGREVAVLIEGQKVAGDHSVAFDASTLSSGVYIYRLETANRAEVRTMMLVK